MFGKWQSILACPPVYSWRPKYYHLDTACTIHRLAHQACRLTYNAVETSTSLCLYSTPFTFHLTALLSFLCSKLFLVAKTGLGLCIPDYAKRVWTTRFTLLVCKLLLHFLLVPSASSRSFWCWKHPVRHDGIRPSTWPLFTHFLWTWQLYWVWQSWVTWTIKPCT